MLELIPKTAADTDEKVLLSVRPEFAKKIASGEKKFEFRLAILFFCNPLVIFAV
ncbi:MAG: ASCH domain-containing protein [Clostridiales Family XIII bacterium]|nr:ASCH domain-containing protein [Clostridiales Family XIII bacterium]